jgi:DNA-binding GntR family transcriptional regulator
MKNIENLNLKIQFPEPKQISLQIYQQLREAIITGKLKGRKRLVESELSKLFGVSRAPIREALYMLAVENFVDLVPYRGAIVSSITSKGVREHFEIKAMFEGFAAYIGAQRFGKKELEDIESVHDKMKRQVEKSQIDKIRESNYAFHKKIIKHVNNERLSQYYDNLSENIRRYGTIGLSDNIDVWNTTVEEHGKIFEAIKMGEGSLAEQLSREHALNAMKRVLETLNLEKNVN